MSEVICGSCLQDVSKKRYSILDSGAVKCYQCIKRSKSEIVDRKLVERGYSSKVKKPKTKDPFIRLCRALSKITTNTHPAFWHYAEEHGDRMYTNGFVLLSTTDNPPEIEEAYDLSTFARSKVEYPNMAKFLTVTQPAIPRPVTFTIPKDFYPLLSAFTKSVNDTGRVWVRFHNEGIQVYGNTMMLDYQEADIVDERTLSTPWELFFDGLAMSMLSPKVAKLTGGPKEAMQIDESYAAGMQGMVWGLLMPRAEEMEEILRRVNLWE